VDVTDQLMPVNYILLAVISGIIGLVLSAFTGFHLYLASTGKTTIESLEKVRYLAPVKQSMQEQLDAPPGYGLPSHPNDTSSLGDHLQVLHANVLPGVTRPEEGEGQTPPRFPPSSSLTPSPATNSLRRSYAELEHSREVARHEAYLDEQDAKKLPHAFDLGWRRNLVNVFGTRLALAWLPTCNTPGDGWHWKVSEKFKNANEQLAQAKESRNRARPRNHDSFSSPGVSQPQQYQPQHWSQAAMLAPNYKRLSTIPSSDGEGSSSDDEQQKRSTAAASRARQGQAQAGQTANWNDIPDAFLQPERTGHGAQRSGGPRPKSAEPMRAWGRTKDG